MKRSATHRKGAHRGDRDPILTLIAVFKYVKALLLVATGLGALQLIRSDFGEQARAWFASLGQSVDVVPVLRLLRRVGALGPGQLRMVGAGAFLYALLFLTEGTGLLMQRRWAEYLTVIATASFIPFEIYEMIRRLTWPRAGALVVNIAVLIYLIWKIRNTGGELTRGSRTRK